MDAVSHAVEMVVASYRKTHRLVLETVEDLSDDQLAYRPNPTTPPIVFHLWHLARYADSLPDQIGLEGGMVWQAEGLAAAWGFDPDALGIYESGTGMGLETPGALPWPSKDALLGYCRRAFEVADEAVGTLDDAGFQRSAKWGGRSAGEAIVTNLEHDNRHLGMIEGMRGVLGLAGSATE